MLGLVLLITFAAVESIAKRRAVRPGRCEASLVFDVAPTPGDAAVIVEHLFKQLLFIRGQIPGAFARVAAEVDAVRCGGVGTGSAPIRVPGRPASRATSQQRRLGKVVDAARAIVHECATPDNFPPGRDVTLYINFGSPTRPKECYELHMRCGEAEAAPDGRRQDALCKQVLRTIVTEAAGLPEGPASAGPIAVRLVMRYRLRADVKGPGGFVHKPGFKMNLSRALHVAVDIEGREQEGDPATLRELAGLDAGGGPCMYFVSSVKVKGLGQAGEI
ncbi:unnamed protein product [Pedinophyceae sp. YPF-701]|nr:unnamed protein product [Pedinophyceae sp. YPF-701]